MKTLITGLSLLLIAGAVNAQVRTNTPPTTTGSGQTSPTYPQPTTAPGTNTINNNGNNPMNGTAPGTTYPATTTTPYPGTNTTSPNTNINTRPGLNPGTGTMPATTTPGRTYSDQNKLINNSPNTTPVSPNPAVGNPSLNGR
jgi:hypothetical protein